MVAKVRIAWVGVTLGVWAVAVVVAFGALWRYGNTPGEQDALPAGWVAPAGLAVAEGRPTLVLFAHPRCPCTRATMAAIERLQRDVPVGFATRVVFYEPVGVDAAWREGGLWSRAGKLVDAHVIADPGGEIAASAGARVSGHVALVGEDGAALFQGGLTPSRGHEGDSLGLLSVRAILRDRRDMEPVGRVAPVYGCSILGSDCSPKCDGVRE